MGNAGLLRLKAWISRSIAHAPRGGANGAKAGTTRLKRQRIGPVSGGDPQQLVILLHGRGADGDDLIALGRKRAPSKLARRASMRTIGKISVTSLRPIRYVERPRLDELSRPNSPTRGAIQRWQGHKKPPSGGRISCTATVGHRMSIQQNRNK